MNAMNAMNAPLTASPSLLASAQGTPCVRLSRLAPAGSGAVYVKWESLSPHMSGYDRVARAWSEQIAPAAGSMVYEAANVAWCISLSSACMEHGVTLHVFLPENAPLEARQTLVLLKVKLTLTPAAEGAKGARERARLLGPLVSEQQQELFANAHRDTAAELMAHVQAEGGRIDAMVCGASTGGLWTACARAVQSVSPSAACWVAALEGDQIALDVSRLDAALKPQLATVLLDEARTTRSALAKKEGMLLSTAQGAVVAVALARARELGADARVFAVVGEGGERTLSVEAD
jgi:cysteine synthase